MRTQSASSCCYQPLVCRCLHSCTDSGLHTSSQLKTWSRILFTAINSLMIMLYIWTSCYPHMQVCETHRSVRQSNLRNLASPDNFSPSFFSTMQWYMPWSCTWVCKICSCCPFTYRLNKKKTTTIKNHSHSCHVAALYRYQVDQITLHTPACTRTYSFPLLWLVMLSPLGVIHTVFSPLSVETRHSKVTCWPTTAVTGTAILSKTTF